MKYRNSSLLKMMFKIFVFASFILFASAHWDPAYFRNSKDGFKYFKNWMKDISDDKILSELALPGTHNSATFNNGKAVVFINTQSLNFKEQLEYGIRVFDIRFRHTSDRFALHHGPVYLNLMFGEFLDAVDQFLSENPSETVLFIIKKDHDDDINNSRSYTDTLKFYLSQHKNTFLKATNNIKLHEARGKFIILNFSEFYDHGLPAHLFDIQDKYKLTTNWDLYDKWIAIRSHLDKAKNGEASQFYLNYLSGSGGVFPYFVASGHSTPGTSASRLPTGLITPGWSDSYPDFPRVKCIMRICAIAFEGTNVLTRDYVKDHCSCARRSVGIVMSDFPGTSLIETVINNNHHSC